MNILALSRHGETLRQRLDHVRFQPGDVLLIQRRIHMLDDALDNMGCLPLAERSYTVGCFCRRNHPHSHWEDTGFPIT